MDTNALAQSPEQQRKQFQEKKADRPPIVLPTTTYTFQLQKQLQGVAKQLFEFSSTKHGARVITKVMVDYQSVKSNFETNNLSYYIFYLKSQKPIKAVISHLPQNTPVEDIAEGLVDLGSDVISVKQMSVARRSPKGTTPKQSPKTSPNSPASATFP
jgi:hypothetical protein